MRIGIPREIKEMENRVGTTPAGVAELVRNGHQVCVEKNAGLGSGFSNIEYQESGWATFLNFCGVLNLMLFVFGGIWLLDAGRNEQFMAMNLTIIGLIAAINSFFFAFLVNTFTRIQHNTHLTTLELIKLNKKNDSDN